MNDLDSIQRELMGTIPRFPFPLTDTYINRAWIQIQDLRLWSWLVGTYDHIVPAVINTGLVLSVNQFATTIRMDSNARTALLPAITDTPPLASTSIGVGRIIRLGVTGSGGPLYRILAADPTVLANTAMDLTIDRAYTGPSATNQTYMVYKPYYAVPPSFLRYTVLTNMRAGYKISSRKLYYSQAKLSAVDPQRGACGDAFTLATWDSDINGNPVYEWYPHPVNAAVYNAVYEMRGVGLSPTVDLPQPFDSSVLVHKTLSLAADWALANVTTQPELQATNWIAFKQTQLNQFKDALLQAIKKDDEMFPWTAFQQGATFDYPLGGQFVQSHDISAILGGMD